MSGLGLIYITDDEPNIRRLTALALTEYGFDTQEFSSGKELFQGIQKRKPDAILLDWVMPEMDGLTVCGRLKLSKDTKTIPVIMLTAHTDEDDCILGLEMGADDYIIKPFSLKELCARVNSVVRRKSYLVPNETNEGVISIGDVSLDLDTRIAKINGKEVDLTMKEFDLLATLMLGGGKVFNRNQLMEKVWSLDYTGDARTVDVHIRYLRKKIEPDEDNPKYIKTVRGVGYKFGMDHNKHQTVPTSENVPIQETETTVSEQPQDI